MPAQETARRKVYEFQVLLYNFELSDPDDWKRSSLSERKKHFDLVKTFCEQTFNGERPYSVTMIHRTGRAAVYGTFSKYLTTTSARNQFIDTFARWLTRR